MEAGKGHHGVVLPHQTLLLHSQQDGPECLNARKGEVVSIAFDFIALTSLWSEQPARCSCKSPQGPPGPSSTFSC